MAIKVTVEATEKPKKNTCPLVCKSESTGTVVLFTSGRSGVCLIAGSGEKVGEYRENWLCENFTPIKGAITIENL